MILLKLLGLFSFDLEWCNFFLEWCDLGKNDQESNANFSVILQAACGTDFFHF